MDVIWNGIMAEKRIVNLLELPVRSMKQTAESDWKKGILSRDGFAVLDDSKTILLTGDGWIKERKQGGEDFYLFAYGHDYRAR